MFTNANTLPNYSRVLAAAGVLPLQAADWLVVPLNGDNGTLGLLNEPPYHDFTLELIQAPSGGPFTPTCWPGITWLTAGGVAPTMPTAGGAVLLLRFKCLGGGAYYGWVVGCS